MKLSHQTFRTFLSFNLSLRSISTTTHQNPYSQSDITKSIQQMNDSLKMKHHQKKEEKTYITKMSPSRIEKIGSQSLLDKQWADKPLGVIKNPHKLTEFELYKALEKIVELPEKRLKTMLKTSGNAVDEVFLANIITRIPQFLTTTLVNLTKTLLIQKDYFKDHFIWKPLEKELFKRRNNLNNEQLAAVIHAFGVSGNGSKQFFYDMEETIIDSPIGIENEYLQKILMGYSQIDQGTAVLYGHIVEKLLKRGLDQLQIQEIVEIAKHLSKSTNVQKAGYGFYEEMEKYIHKGLHEGKIGFTDLCQIAENILPQNIGSNEFHQELEKFIIEKFTAVNLQEVTELIKGLSLYSIKNTELEQLIFKTVALNMNEFTVKQLESLIWSLSRSHKSPYLQKKFQRFNNLPDYQKATLEMLIEKVRLKTPSMKARGVAFAIESIQNLEFKNEDVFKKLEKVVLSKLDDFIPHYIVKVLSSYYKMGYGSGELYDKLINKVVESMNEEGTLKYSDMLRFFEIFPEVSYIYDNTMSEDFYSTFMSKIQAVIKDKKFPTEDLCRVFNILIRISPYQPQKKLQQHNKFMAELLGRLRHSIYDIPKEYFTLTFSNLIEFQQLEIAKKFFFIVQECSKQGKLQSEFANDEERIQLFWSLLQLEKSCEDKTIINEDNMKFLSDVDPNTLTAKTFLMYKQLLCLVQMFWLAQAREFEQLNFDSIYERLSTSINKDKREEFINEDSATKSNQGVTQEIAKILKQSQLFTQITPNLSDDLMTLINVACVQQTQPDQQPDLFGFLIMNKHCYINTISEDEPILKRSVNLKQDILHELFDWNIILIDEQDFMRLSSNEEKSKYITQRLQQLQQPGQIQQEMEPKHKQFGRKLKRLNAKQ